MLIGFFNCHLRPMSRALIVIWRLVYKKTRFETEQVLTCDFISLILTESPHHLMIGLGLAPFTSHPIVRLSPAVIGFVWLKISTESGDTEIMKLDIDNKSSLIISLTFHIQLNGCGKWCCDVVVGSFTNQQAVQMHSSNLSQKYVVHNFVINSWKKKKLLIVLNIVYNVWAIFQPLVMYPRF